MLTIRDLLDMELFKDFSLIAGRKGLDNPVQNATTLEYETFLDNYQEFHKYDLILTTLFYAKDNESLILDSFEKLLKQGVSAIAVKVIFYDALPDEVLRFADANGLPLFLFRDTYMEDIIVAVSQTVFYKQQRSYYEEALSDILNAPSSLTVQETARLLLESSKAPYQVYYFAFTQERSVWLPLTDSLFRRYFHSHANKYPGNLVLYQNGLFFFHVLAPQAPQSYSMQEIQSELHRYHLPVHIGVSNRSEDRNHLPGLCREAMFASRLSRMRSIPIQEFHTLGVYTFLLPLFYEEAVMNTVNRDAAALIEYDNTYRSDLFKTAQAYIKNSGKISDTAKDLFQHVNTIRYRLQKLEELLGYECFYEELWLTVKLYELTSV